jgi:hypothetical protein
VERAAQTIQQDFFRPHPRGDSLEELNQRLADECLMRARQRRHPEQKDRTVYEVFLEEQKLLYPAKAPFAAFVSSQTKASNTLLVQCDRNQYSAEAIACNRPVELRRYADRIQILHSGRIVGEHVRCFDRDRIIPNPLHYLPAPWPASRAPYEMAFPFKMSFCRRSCACCVRIWRGMARLATGSL